MALFEKIFERFSEASLVAIIVAIIGFVGIIMGNVFSYYFEKRLNNQDYKRKIYEKRLQIYPKALEYIKLFAKLKQQERINSDIDYRKQLMIDEKKLLEDFYADFMFISSKKVLDRFDELRERIQKENVTMGQAFKELSDVMKKEKYKL